MSKGQTCKHKGWHKCHQPYCLSELAQAKKVILLSVFPGEYSALMRDVEISQNSPLIKLNPVLGEDGLIRVGGRLTHAPVVSDERYPIVLPRRTRADHAESKHWAILFTCMSTRAVHIEVIESLDTSSCINARRRFFAIRGQGKLFRSDCGTNFVAATKELGFSKMVKDPEMQEYLTNCSCSWEFNLPHASHIGTFDRCSEEDSGFNVDAV